MMRNVLLYLSLLVVACYANRVVMRSAPADDVADVDTLWRYGKKDPNGGAFWKKSKAFLVKFKDVPKPQEFIEGFKFQGKSIGESYAEDSDGFTIGFESASTNPSASNAEVIGTIDLSKSKNIEINVPTI
eukprot:Platyproteum_vivax@DN17486_c0_g1_i1.p1